MSVINALTERRRTDQREVRLRYAELLAADDPADADELADLIRRLDKSPEQASADYLAMLTVTRERGERIGDDALAKLRRAVPAAEAQATEGLRERIIADVRATEGNAVTQFALASSRWLSQATWQAMQARDARVNEAQAALTIATNEDNERRQRIERLMSAHPDAFPAEA